MAVEEACRGTSNNGERRGISGGLVSIKRLKATHGEQNQERRVWMMTIVHQGIGDLLYLDPLTTIEIDTYK